MSSAFQTQRLQQRATALRWALAAAFLVLAVAFFKAQVLDAERYRLRSKSNRLRAIPITAPRGAILDRNGLVVADNVPGFTVKLIASDEDSLRAALGRMASIVTLDTAEAAKVVRRWRSARYQPALVFNSSSFDVISRLEEHRLELPGLLIQTEPRRFYPGGKAVAHLVGYVGEVSEGDLERNRFPGARMGTIVGRDGLEAQYDSVLRGREGMQYVEVNARGAMVRQDESGLSLKADAGRPLATSLDLPLQLYVDSLWTDSLAQFRGSLVAMTPKGEILALYSWPTFDPNDFVGGIAADRYRELTDTSSGLPLLNRVLRGAYPPASPFKLATAAMALRRGLVTFSTHMDQPCNGGLRFGNRVFKCWKKEGHGSLDLTGAIATSCDVYFYQLGLKLGLTNLLADGVAFGFREKAGIDLTPELRSFFPPSRDYYDKAYGPRGWTNAVVLNLAIGQGENDQTLLNMTRFYAALAGDGQLRPPHLVAPAAGAAPRSLELTPAQLAGLREAMIAVVTRGTAAASRGQDLNVAGKTGTAQNPHGADHGWFIGFAPSEAPEIVVGAILEKGLHGSSVAPYVVRVIRRYLAARGRPDDSPVELLVPQDTTPGIEEVPADTTRGAGR
jgi:penicillin-binding protein 2